MKTGLIYKATNKLSGKSYIGLTTKALKERIRGHIKDSKIKNHTFKFANALRKYNFDDWDWIILHKDIPFKYLSKMEEFYIFLFNTYNEGYNSTKGGEHSPMHNPISRRKNALARTGKSRPDVAERNRRNRGKKLSEEHEKKLSDNFSGKNNPFYGKTHSDETRLKMSKAKENYIPWNKGKPHSEETKRKLKEAWKRRKERDK